MKNKQEKLLEFLFLKNHSTEEKRKKINNKRGSNKNQTMSLYLSRENEWEQEYYIIYNSYVLDQY